MLTVARAIGVLCLLGLIGFGIALGMGKLGSYTGKPCFTGKAAGLEDSPALALEFADKEGEVQQYLDQSGMRQEVLKGLAADNFFIAAYWLLFAGLCVLLAGRGFKRRGGRSEWRYEVWLAVVAAVCVTGAAVADTVENARITTLVEATTATKELIANIAAASSWKWALIALATLALSPVFLWGGGRPARLFGAALFLIYLVAGALMLCGVLWEDPQLIVKGFKTLLAGSAVIAFVFTLKPEWAAGVSKDAAGETR